jgi:hypothetical protein
VDRKAKGQLSEKPLQGILFYEDMKMGAVARAPRKLKGFE